MTEQSERERRNGGGKLNTFTPGHPRLVPGRGRYAGQVFVLHGCMSDGPYTYPQARVAIDELRRNPVPAEVYRDYERRGLGGRATHFLTNDLTALDPAKMTPAIERGAHLEGNSDGNPSD